MLTSIHPSGMPLSGAAVMEAIIPHPHIFEPEALLVDVIKAMGQIQSKTCPRLQREQLGQWNLMVDDCALVVAGRQVLGICTSGDLVHLAIQGQSPRHVTLAEVMTRPVITWTVDQLKDVFSTLQFMQRHQIGHLPIVDQQGSLLGLVTPHSLRHLLKLADLLRLRHISEVMQTQVVQVSYADSVLDVARQMAHRQVSCVVVVEATAQGPDRPVGIISEGDIAQFLYLELDLAKLQASSVMSPAYCLQPHHSLWTAQQLMQAQQVWGLVITDCEGTLQGLLTHPNMLDILTSLERQETFKGLQQRIYELEAEKLALLHCHNQDLEEQVAQRTSEIRERADREQFLATLARQISQSFNLDGMLSSAVTEVKHFLDCDRVVVYRFHDDLSGTVIAEAVEPQWSSTLGSQYQDVCFPKWLEANYLDGRQRIVDDIYQANLSDCHIEFLESLQIKGYLVVPILIGNHLWGILAAHQCAAPKAWQNPNLDLLDRLGTHLAIAIQQRQLYQQAQVEIRERQQAELALQQERNFANAILNAAGALVVVLDRQGRIVQFNQTCEQVTGYRFQEVVNRPLGDILLPPEERDRVLGVLQELLAHNFPNQYENHWQTKTGELRLIAWSNTALLDGEGQVEYVIATGVDVTEARRAEDALRRSESTNRALLDTIPDLMIRLKRDGTYIDFLPARGFRVLFPSENIKGKSIYDTMPRSMAEERMVYVWRALDTHQTQIYEYQLEVDGQTCYEEARIAVSDHDEVLVIVRDISDRKRAEAKRQQAEAALHSLVKGTAAVTGENFFEALVQHIVKALNVRHALITTYEGTQGHTIAFCSGGQLQSNISYDLGSLPWDATLQQQVNCCPNGFSASYPDHPLVFLGADSYLGLTLQDISGRPIGTLDVFDSQPIINRSQMESILTIFAARAAAELERQQTIDALHRLNQELETRVELRTEELSNSNMALRKSNMALLESREQLRRSEELLRLTIDNAPIGIVTTTLDGQFRTVNQACCSMLGYTPEEIRDQTFLDLTHPDDRSVSQEKMRQLMSGEMSTFAMEKRYLHKGGAIVHAIVRVGIVRDIEEQPLHFVAEIEDIRDRKRAEAEVHKALEAERELNDLKSRFVSMASHEFRTPLGVIASSVGIIQDYGDRLDQEKQQKHLNRIQDSVNYMTQLLEDVLMLSRVEAGKLSVKRTPLAIYEFCQELVEELNVSCDNARIHIDIDPSLPHQIMFDQRLLRQILTNLLSNALKYSFPGSNVNFQIAYRADSVILTIRDQGIGIPSEDLKHLFQSFHRARNVGNIPGTGLGLSIVKKLVELHQGTIRCQSQINQGTTFTLRFPL